MSAEWPIGVRRVDVRRPLQPMDDVSAYPRVRVFTLLPLGFFITTVALPAWGMLIYWMVLQVFGGLAQSVAEQGGGVAFWAHIGGFVAGVVLIKVFERRDRVAAHTAHTWRPQM